MFATSCHGIGQTAGASGVFRCPTTRGITWITRKRRVRKNAARRRCVLEVVVVFLFIFWAVLYLFNFEIFPQNHSCLYFSSVAVVEESARFSQGHRSVSSIFLKFVEFFLLLII